MFMILGLASLVCGFLWGFLADWIGRKRAMIIILLIQAVSYALFALWTGTGGHRHLGRAVRPHRLGHPGHHGRGLRGYRGAADGARPPTASSPPSTASGRPPGRTWPGKLADSLPTFTASYLMAAGVAFLGAIALSCFAGRSAPRRTGRAGAPSASAGRAAALLAPSGVCAVAPQPAARRRPVRRSLYP